MGLQEIKHQPFPMAQPSEKFGAGTERGLLRGQYAPARRDETVIRSIQECQRRVRLCP